MEPKPFHSNKAKARSILPKMPPSSSQEPLRGVEAGKIVCPICGKTFKTHSQFDRHYESMHGTPEKTHTKPHV
ncbi:MAG: C2H2-type zinc finger protein [Candidatus Bathyarchaeota archaeon]|nr:C2H2-type zinc finger protein [Candidatus Bathyarchaeota archaeon]